MTALELIQRAYRLIQVAPPGDDENASTRSVQDLIKRVLRILSVADATQSLTANQITTGTDALNDMLSRWQRNGVISGLTLPLETTDGLALTTQAWQAVEYNMARMLASEFGAPLRPDVVEIAKTEYDRLALDVPHTVSGALRAMNEMISRWQRDGIGLSYVAIDIADVTLDVTIPSESWEAVAHNLAVKIASEMGKEPTALVFKTASDGYTALLRDSQGVLHADLDAMPSTVGNFNINTGY